MAFSPPPHSLSQMNAAIDPVGFDRVRLEISWGGAGRQNEFSAPAERQATGWSGTTGSCEDEYLVSVTFFCFSPASFEELVVSYVVRQVVRIRTIQIRQVAAVASPPSVALR